MSLCARTHCSESLQSTRARMVDSHRKLIHLLNLRVWERRLHHWFPFRSCSRRRSWQRSLSSLSDMRILGKGVRCKLLYRSSHDRPWPKPTPSILSPVMRSTGRQANRAGHMLRQGPCRCSDWARMLVSARAWLNNTTIHIISTWRDNKKADEVVASRTDSST